MVHKQKKLEEMKPSIIFSFGGKQVSGEEFMKKTRDLFSKVHVTSGYEMEMDEQGIMRKKRRIL